MTASNPTRTALTDAARADTALTDTERADGDRRLLAAAHLGDIVEVRAALIAGAGCDATDERGRTAILLAAMGGHHDVVDALIVVGADIDRQDRTCLNPLLLGCIRGDLRLVRTMLAAGAATDRLTRFGGLGLLPAAEKGHVDVVEELLRTTDMNVDHTNSLGWTALIEAILLGDGGHAQQQIVRLLLQHGADPELTDERGATPRDIANRLGYTQIEALLTAAVT